MSVLLPNSDAISSVSTADGSEDDASDEGVVGADDGSRSSQNEPKSGSAKDSHRLSKAKASRFTIIWNTYLTERRRESSSSAANQDESSEERTPEPQPAVSTDDPEIELLGPLLNAISNAFLHIPVDDKS